MFVLILIAGMMVFVDFLKDSIRHLLIQIFIFLKIQSRLFVNAILLAYLNLIVLQMKLLYTMKSFKIFFKYPKMATETSLCY